MVSAIMTEQSMGHSGPITLSVSPSHTQTVQLPGRHLTLAELQRLKRQFITVHKKAVTLGTTEKGAVNWDEADIAYKFSLHLEEHLQ
jgi:protein KTI12